MYLESRKLGVVIGGHCPSVFNSQPVYSTALSHNFLPGSSGEFGEHLQASQLERVPNRQPSSKEECNHRNTFRLLTEPVVQARDLCHTPTHHLLTGKSHRPQPRVSGKRQQHPTTVAGRKLRLENNRVKARPHVKNLPL